MCRPIHALAVLVSRDTLQIYIHTYIHTHTHTYILTYVHTYIHIHIHTHTYVRTYIHTYTHIHMHIRIPSIVERLDARTKNSRKIRFETRIKIRKSNHERGIAQHGAVHATVSQQIRTRLVECCWSVCASARPVLL